jgi:transcriptional regulator with GAF, ATPase, and Fis domain
MYLAEAQELESRDDIALRSTDARDFVSRSLERQETRRQKEPNDLLKLDEQDRQLVYLVAREIRTIHRIRDLQAVYRLSQQLTSNVRMSEQDVLALIHNNIAPLMDTENMYIAMYDKATDTVRFPLMFVDGKPQQVAARSGGKGRTEWIVKNRKPIFIETRAESVKWYKECQGKEYIGEPFPSWIGVPMMAEDKVLGVIATYHKTKDYVYTKDDQEVLELMASQAAIVLQNARMWEAMQKLSEDLDAGALPDVE